MNLIKQYLKNKFANQPSTYAPRAPHNLPSNYWEPTPDEEDYKNVWNAKLKMVNEKVWYMMNRCHLTNKNME